MARKKRRFDDEIENPRPRIGRKDKIFIPSKRLQKKYKKVRDTYKRQQEIQQHREEQRQRHYEDTYYEPQPLSIEEAFERGIVGSKVRQEPIYTSIIDKAAIIANVYGIDGAANVLNVNEDLLNYALEGNRLDRRDTAIIQRGYDDAIINDADIDFDKVEHYAERLKTAIEAVNEERYEGDRLKNQFRYIVAEGKFDIEKGLTIAGDAFAWEALMDTGRSLTGDERGMTPRVKHMLLEWMSQDDTTAEQINNMLDIWRLDLEFNPEIDEGINQSLWWAWFREIFYP